MTVRYTNTVSHGYATYRRLSSQVCLGASHRNALNLDNRHHSTPCIIFPSDNNRQPCATGTMIPNHAKLGVALGDGACLPSHVHRVLEKKSQTIL
ncbi:hypothetical protein BaRGS_00035719 [Batillaria attramentaria]|uniref:Uncharacterized protein n=1 Tax=Batillaria attramentaria TaxID=370345 RepID=A0ABD0JDM0_9CAEN